MMNRTLLKRNILPPAMRGFRPDLYLNLKTNWAQYRNGPTIPATNIVVESRASVATQVDALGNWRQAASGQMAFSDTVTGASIYEARTNSVRNNTMQGAVSGSPGTLPTNWSEGATGLTRTIVGTGTFNGVNYIDIRFNGTTTSQFGGIPFDNVTTAYGQTWVISCFAALVATPNIANLAGSGFGFKCYNNTINEAMTNNILSILNANFVPWTRWIGAFTNPTPASTSDQFSWQYTMSGASGLTADFTVRLGWPQMENLTAYFPATVASAVKAANGTGGVNGTGVYSITGGTFTTQATLNCTWAAGVLTINSVANAGSYSVLPASPATIAYVSGTATGWTTATVTIAPTDNSAKAWASLPIATTGAAATRVAEADTLSLAGLPAFGTAYTIWGRGTPQQLAADTTPQVLFEVDDNSTANRLTLARAGGGAAQVFSITGNSATYNQTASAWPSNASWKLAVSTIAGAQAGAYNGTAFTGGTIALPVAVNKVAIGHVQGTSQFDGNVEELAVWFTQALAGATLQMMTT